MNLSDYILLPREKRIAHIDLATPCELDKRSQYIKDALVDFFGLENDVENWVNGKIHQCHLCESGRRKGHCGNPLHIYLGTASENHLDTDAEWRKERSHKAGSASKGTPWSKTAKKKEKFLIDLLNDPSLYKVSSRKLGTQYEVSHNTIQMWKREFTSERKE